MFVRFYALLYIKENAGFTRKKSNKIAMLIIKSKNTFLYIVDKISLFIIA